MQEQSTFAECSAARFRELLLLWLLFFSIGAGLGYPVLNRYQPDETPALSDTGQYAEIVQKGPGLSGRNSYRILQPLLARPIERLVRGRLGSWSALFFALLCVCSIFTAATATLQFSLALRAGLDPATALLSCCLLLLNFVVPNHMLAGMVDASEAFFLMLTAWILSRNLWMALPLLGATGALAKETYVVLGTAMASAWFFVQFRRRRAAWPELGWVIGMGAAGLIAYTMLRYAIDGTILLPWRFALDQRSDLSLWQGFISSISDPGFYYGLVWMMPLGVWKLYKLPREWVLSSLAAAVMALLLGSYHSAGGSNIARPIFSAIGPIFSMGTACFLTELMGGKSGASNSPPCTAQRVK